MTLWDHLPDPPPDEARIGDALLAEYLAWGALRRTPRALAGLPAGALTHFYRALARGHGRSTRGPVVDRADSSWMREADFCFINLRATGTSDGPGTFLHAAKLLPGLRVNAIHLAPFTDYDFGVIYAIRSTRTLARQLVDPRLPLSPEDQLRAFVEAAHLLNMAVGFDLEPHVTQFAIPVIMRPELFRWLRLSPFNRNELADGLTQEAMLEEAYQATIVDEIRAIVAEALAAENLSDLEAVEGDPLETRERKRALYFRLIGTLIERGLWTIPAQSWAGSGLPAFDGYNFEDNYARFAYRSADGADLHASAFHIVTPYKFVTGLPANSAPKAAPAPYQPAIDYYAAIFPYWRDRFGFDFVRFDSVDHVFDSLTEDGQPTSDRPSPAVLKTCITAARGEWYPYVGALAERMGDDLEQYAAIGFELLLGDDVMRRVDSDLIARAFALADRLAEFNDRRAQRASIAFAIDTHDSGAPGLLGEPLVKLAGPAQMRLRHFVSRFLGAGAARRPKYEAIGSQDLSHGLFMANVTERNLTWVGDADFNAHYHFLEDIYLRARPLLDVGALTERHVDARAAWWRIDAGAHGWLAAVIAFEAIDGLTIPLPAGAPDGCALIDFESLEEQPLSFTGNVLEVAPLPAQMARLYLAVR
jgi:hypothetical protein